MSAPLLLVDIPLRQSETAVCGTLFNCISKETPFKGVCQLADKFCYRDKVSRVYITFFKAGMFSVGFLPKNANANEYVDIRFIEELEKSGYIDGLYRQ